MKDDSWSWSKPDNVPGLAGRKKVDKTLIETGTTAIPIPIWCGQTADSLPA